MTKDRPSPISQSNRAARTETLIAAKATDVERWAELNSLATAWDARANRAASFIPDGASVLDLGCGAMALRNYLKPTCTYTPADVAMRSPDCYVVDINKREFPPGRYDWIAILGVLEYIHDTAWPLAKAREFSSHLLVTYCCDTSGDVSYRRGLGWVSDFTVQDFVRLLNGCDWKVGTQVLDKQGAGNAQMMFVCE